MKKFSKLIFSCAAVAALTAAVGTAAMAADPTVSGDGITGTYNVDTGALTLVVPTTENTGGDQTTILMFEKGAEADGISDTEIIHIDQDTSIAGATLNTAKVVKPETGSKTYVIRIGGNGTFTDADGFLEAELKIDADGTVTPSTRLLGDVNGKDGIDIIDASGAAKHFAKITLLTGDDLLAADVDDNGKVEIIDASGIAKYIVKLDTPVDGVKTVGDKKNQTVE